MESNTQHQSGVGVPTSWKQLVTLLVAKYVGGCSHVTSGWNTVPTWRRHSTQVIHPSVECAACLF